MPTLTEAYKARIEPELAKKLRQAESLHDAGRFVRDALAPLFDPQGDFLGDMLLHQSNVARSLLNQVDHSARLLQSALTTKVVQQQPPPRSASDATGVITTTTVAAALASLVSQVFPGLIALPVGAGVGIGCAFAYCTLRPSLHSQDNATVEISSLDPDAILEWIKDSLQVIDRILNDTVLKPVPPEKPLHAFEDVIGLLQDLLSESAISEQPLPEMLTFQMGRIPKLLGAHGISVRSYDPVGDGPSPDSSIWIVERQKGLGVPQTLAPVLVKDGKALRPGRVLLGE